MCKLDGTKCDNCLEYRVITDSGAVLEFTFDPNDADNDVIKTWLFATECVESVEMRNVGSVVWSVFTREEFEEEVGINL